MSSQSIAPADKYPLSLRILHWVRAALILGLIWLGWFMAEMPDAVPAKFDLYFPLHKEFGVLTFLVVIVQLLIRSRSAAPPPPAAFAPWERKSAATVHWLLYALAVLVPLSGYAMSSTFEHSAGVPFFFVQLPELLPKSRALAELFEALHGLLAYALLALVVFHIAGALKHRFLRRDPAEDVLRRII